MGKKQIGVANHSVQIQAIIIALRLLIHGVICQFKGRLSQAKYFMVLARVMSTLRGSHGLSTRRGAKDDVKQTPARSRAAEGP